MRTPTALAGLALLLLTGCAAEEEPLEPAAAASASCAQIADLLERPGLRMSDVARLGKAQDAAATAAEAEPGWSGLASSMATLKAAAVRVAESAQRPTSNTEQHEINEAYVAARSAAAEACAEV